MNLCAHSLWENVVRLRKEAPLVHNITNYVVMNSTANALLALGASPVMAHEILEVEEMVSISRALVVNIGTLSSPWVESMKRGISKASELHIPVVLDPVGLGATSYRAETVSALLAAAPVSVIRGNASEIQALVSSQERTKGVDSLRSSENALEAAELLANRYNCVICISGARDYVIAPDKKGCIENGNSLMTRVTGMGCTASAFCGAFLAVEEDPFSAVLHAMAVMGVAGELAALNSQGPGSLQQNFLDILHNLTEEDLKKQ
ncbi:MAG TPA: hydroxyethylthiazole kinase, partial [Synergistaceae bacterium]|nr:hydroxyethylthiazole kinase [Synergistaceae bacterium]